MTKQGDENFGALPPVKYDGIVREGSYMMRGVLAAYDASLGINLPPKSSAEDQARVEYKAIVDACTHARNVLRSLAARRDVLADALEVVERPRMAAAEGQQGAVKDSTGYGEPRRE